ncbi:uncharacterized protein LOC133528598 isoform X2 [Cydia pomonella]|uniref:uncharacterized protein LOC133528598 isoform X2 n=1 Tax=Cydia pomonella TaxID=82600 RepID=UPI002ADD54ED|nr:uncharacterized protein LOC133528598 isoform X2 [Cydia pomonella]
MRLHILLLFLLTSGWICCGYAAGVSLGGEQEQDPNNPEYQKMAEELVHSYLHLKVKHMKKVVVHKVTTQEVEGTITRIQFQVFLVNGESSTCNFEIWEKTWEKLRLVTSKCDSLFSPNQLSSRVNSRPGQERDPKNQKYKKLANLAISDFFAITGKKPFKKEDVKAISVTTAKVKVNSKITSVLTFDVTTVKNDRYKCKSVVVETPWETIETTKVTDIDCDITTGEEGALLDQSNENELGGQELQNPKDAKYIRLAKESFKKYLESHTSVKISVIKLTVDKVTTQVVAGTMIRIDFHVDPSKGQKIPCKSEIWEKVNKQLDFNVTCQMNKLKFGGEQEQNPQDPKYKRLAAESFEKYREKHRPRFSSVSVKKFILTKVTTQVVEGVITRLDFNAILTKGKSLQCHSEISERPGQKRKNIDVKCSDKRDPIKKLTLSATSQKLTVIPGGEANQDPADPKYKKLAKKSFKKYQMSHSLHKFTIKELRVTKVTTQVVSGVIIRIDFKAIPTKGNALQCHSEILDQPWLQNKNIEVKCVPFFNAKLSATTEIIAGGEMEQDPGDPEYKRLAEESLKKYRMSHNLRKFTLKELRVTKATSQVVSGVIFRIDFKAISTNGNSLQCHSEILDQPWLQNKNIEVKCVPFSNTKLSVTTEMIAGGEMEHDPGNPKYKRLAEESFEKYRMSHHLRTFTLKELRVTKATSQVVSGVIFRIDFKAISTNGNALQCHSEILDQPWLQNKNIEVKCEPFSNAKLSATTETIAGGKMEQDPGDPEYKRLAEESFKKYRMSHNLRKFTLKELRVTKATSQVVSGVIFRIDFKAISTNDYALQCHSEILDQPWLQNKNIEVKCEPFSNAKLSATTDMIAGGEMEQDPGNPKYKRLAEESLKKYRMSHNLRKFTLKELRVTKATSQVVSGVILRIDFKAIPTNGDALQCHSEILEQPWLQNKNIEVNCLPSKLRLSQSASNPKISGQSLIDQAITDYFNTMRWTVKHSEIRSLNKIRTRLGKEIISYYKVDVFASEKYGGSSYYNCSVVFVTRNKWIDQIPIGVNCNKHTHLLGRIDWVDPTRQKIRYLILASRALKEYMRTSKNKVDLRGKFDIVVTFVTSTLAAGRWYAINFVVRPLNADVNGLKCYSKIWENLNGYKKITEVNCDRNI